MRKFICLLLVLAAPSLLGQESDYSVNKIPANLKKNANAVVRKQSIEIDIESVNMQVIRLTRVVTVLNDYGDRYVRAYEFYDDETKIKHQRAYIYDESGEEIDKIKEKDFRDRSMVSDNNLYDDSRLSYLDYTPRDYPYTVVYESEVERSSTAFVRSWRPLPSYYLSVENSSYKLTNSGHIPMRFQELNLDSLDVNRSNSRYELDYTLNNLPAFKYERLSPDLEDFMPQLRVALNNFSLVGVEGRADNWRDFGKWQYENLLQGTDELSGETVEKISNLIASAETEREKARLIYEYVQEKTRYISVQLGIGGWKPMKASDVDRLGYGDCKALTNYTRALLDSQGISSNYAVVFAGDEITDIDSEFASMQGNHVILNVPQQEGDDIWLECTSQTHPFDYLGDFTDNRNVLLVKPEGGEIVKTRKYSARDNQRDITCLVKLDKDGSYSAEIERSSTGVEYGNIYPIQSQSEDDIENYYLEAWGHLHSLEIEAAEFDNDRKNQVFTEELKVNGKKLATRAGNRLLLSLNFLLPDIYQLQRDEDRSKPVEILRGESQHEHFKYVLPSGFDAEALPENIDLKNEYGQFSLQFELKEEEGKKIIAVERAYVINEGKWPAASYSEFRNFMNKINISCNQKAVIVATN